MAIEITLDFVFKIAVYSIMFTFAAVGILYGYIFTSIKEIKEAVFLIVAADPKLADKIAKLFKKEKFLDNMQKDEEEYG